MKQFSSITFITFLIFLHQVCFAQDCNCDHVITPQNTYINGESMNIKPGDVICIKAGQYKMLNLFNFSGTADKPITFINCGGQVKIGGYQHYYGLLINNVSYFRFTGTGDAGIKYGFKIDGINQSGSGIAGYGTHAEIDHVEISHTGFAGILYKHDPSCDPTSWRQNFVMRQVSVHDNYVHDTKGEGLYIGYTGSPKTLNCDGKSVTVYPHNIEGLRVFNNQIENTGWDGLQVSRVVKDCEIYNNTIKNFGMAREKYQDEGILIGGGTTGKVYNNTVIKGTGVGIQVFGAGGNYVYNNVIVEPEADGIFCDDRETVQGRGFYFINNTIINPGEAGMRMYSRQSSGNVFYNNIVVGTSQNTILLNAPIDWKTANNIFVSNVSAVGFVDPGHQDYRLKNGSSAVDAGKDVASYGVRTDHESQKRPQGKGYDIGAFEYGSGGAPANQAPTVTASQDVTLTLPDNSTTLTATASDANGQITQYDWSQVSGPSAAALTNQHTANLKVSNLREGTYTFKIQVRDDNNATASDQVSVKVKDNTASAGSHGLKYAYYEGNWDKLPDFDQLTAKKSGTVSDFTLTPRSRDDEFGFVFEGYIDISTAGQYTFYTASDDGSALYIDGKKVADNDGLHGKKERSGNISLSKGLHPIQVIFFEKGGHEVLEVSYSGPGFDKKLIPDNVLYPDNRGSTSGPTSSNDPAGNYARGIHYQYYEGDIRTSSDFARFTVLKQGTIANFSLSPRKHSDYFGFVYEGFVEIKTDGNYSFYTTSDDGSRLWIDGKEVVNNDGLHAARERTGSMQLTQGMHAIKVTFFEHANKEILEVSYSGPGFGKKLIPDEVLYYSSTNNARFAQKGKGPQEDSAATQSGNGKTAPFSVLAFPNPVEDVISLAVEGYPVVPQHIKVSLIDLNGHVTDLSDRLQYQGNTIRINTATLSLPAGMYFLHILTEDKNSARIKVMIK